MHSESWSIWALACAEGCPLPGPPPGNSLRQLDWADWNAGDCGLTPEPA